MNITYINHFKWQSFINISIRTIIMFFFFKCVFDYLLVLEVCKIITMASASEYETWKSIKKTAFN